MKYYMQPRFVIALLLSGTILLSSFFNGHKTNQTPFIFPYKQAGLTERQAAAHLVSRFTYGATPNEIDEVLKTGLEKWFEQQLNGSLPDDSLNTILKQYDALNLSNTEAEKIYARPGQVLKMAIKDGYISKDSVNKDNKAAYRDVLKKYMEQKGMKSEKELFKQFIDQKIVRAAYSTNQLQEVLTDFWFNHFNVSITKGSCALYIPSYERDVIRPNVTAKFSDLLLATAKSPAMLYYLDNFSSSRTNDNKVPERVFAKTNQMQDSTLLNNKNNAAKKARGLNENYAREVMELHTLGVDGGYTQQDVTEAARILTGWTVYSQNKFGNETEEQLTQLGFVHEGDFLFVPKRHDQNAKTVLGINFPANTGYEEGVKLLEMLAHHTSTAKFISRKLAVRFVSDNPPQSLIDRMAKTFTEKDGDIKQVLITMASSPEFWSSASVREKTKSPFELAISAVRALNASVQQPYQLYNWINKMGQKMYFYQAPTGFPDKAQYWINTGALLNRMNFGLALTSQRIPGIRINLIALNHNYEPESPLAALQTYSMLILPERNLDATIKRLTPLLNDLELTKKVSVASKNATPIDKTDTSSDSDEMEITNEDKEKNTQKNKIQEQTENKYAPATDMMLAQVVGIIIGSPEFQRR